MSMAIIGVAITGASVGLSASGALNPRQPDLASSSAALSNAKAQMLPFQRGLEAAAAKGEDYEFELPPGINPATYGFSPANGQSVQQVFVKPTDSKGNAGGLFSKSPAYKKIAGQGQWVAYNPDDFKAGGKYEGQKANQIRTITTNEGNKYKVSFKGYGTADTQGKLAEQNAKNSLALSKKYDSQFIQSALEQERLADPEGTAARARMHELIAEQANNKPDQPVAQMLSDQVGAQLKAGRGLDAFDRSALDQAVSESLGARGGGGGGVDFSDPLTSGFAGESRRSNAARKALAFMTSGSTPEDVNYRRNQQDIANLTAEINGQTPQSQFSSLSGAQQGPTPQVNGAALPTMSGGNTQQAASAATTAYGNAMAQPNQWMAGISTLLNGLGAAGQAGWKPLGG